MTRVRAALSALRKLVWPLLLIGAAGVVAYLRLVAPVAVRVARVERAAVVEEAFGRGTVESDREAAVGFDMTGRISEVLVDEGQRVTLGQELARLETTQSEADLRLARTGVAAARATLSRLAADEERARTLLSAAERDSRRAQELFDAGALPAQQRDDAADKLRVSRADLDRLLAQRGEATRSIEVASSGAEQREVTVLRAMLLAPFDGLVTRRLREPGDTVSIGSTILRIVDTSQVYVRASIDETVLPRMAEDQPATILFPGATTTGTGKVTRIAWEADRQTHEIFVDIKPDKLDRRIAVGQRADVRIELARRPDVLRVSIAMVHRDAEGPYVFVDRSGRIAVARPRLGASGKEHVEITDGLAEGDTVLGSPDPGGVLTAGRRWKAQ
jgi:HlyD family secretion protein